MAKLVASPRTPLSRAARAPSSALLVSALTVAAPSGPAQAAPNKKAAAAHLDALDAVLQPVWAAEGRLVSPRIGLAADEAPCAAYSAAAATLHGGPIALDSSLRAALEATLTERAEVCEELGVPMLKLLNEAVMTEAKLREADGLYLQLLTELQRLDDEDSAQQAAFAKKHGVEAPPRRGRPETATPGLAELPATGTGFEPVLVAQASLAHHNLMMSYILEAKAAMNVLLAIPPAPGAPIAEALPKAVGKVARARSGCDTAGAWFEDTALLDACVSATNTYSRLLSGPLADLSLDCADNRWGRRTLARVNLILRDLQSDMPLADRAGEAGSAAFQQAWHLGAAPPAPAPKD